MEYPGTQTPQVLNYVYNSVLYIYTLYIIYTQELYVATYTPVTVTRDAHQDLAKIGDLDSSSDRIK